MAAFADLKELALPLLEVGLGLLGDTLVWLEVDVHSLSHSLSATMRLLSVVMSNGF